MPRWTCPWCHLTCDTQTWVVFAYFWRNSFLFGTDFPETCSSVHNLSMAGCWQQDRSSLWGGLGTRGKWTPSHDLIWRPCKHLLRRAVTLSLHSKQMPAAWFLSRYKQMLWACLWWREWFGHRHEWWWYVKLHTLSLSFSQKWPFAYSVLHLLSLVLSLLFLSFGLSLTQTLTYNAFFSG